MKRFSWARSHVTKLRRKDKRILKCPECRAYPAINGGRCFDCRGRGML
jgi:hypothetical protein